MNHIIAKSVPNKEIAYRAYLAILSKRPNCSRRDMIKNLGAILNCGGGVATTYYDMSKKRAEENG